MSSPDNVPPPRDGSADVPHGALLSSRWFAPLFWCQFLAALADNLQRNALALLLLWSAGRAPGWITAAASGAFVAPSMLLSGLGGELADRYDKAMLARRLKLADCVATLVAAAGIVTGQALVLFAALLGSGIVAALFGPTKYAILPDHLPAARLTAANALVEAATFAAILGGSILAGVLLADGGAAGPLLVALTLIAAAVLSWLAARLIPPTGEKAPALVVQRNLIASTARLLRLLIEQRRVASAAAAGAWFWMAGSAVLALMPGLVRDRLGGGPELATLCLVMFACGVAAGAGLAAALGRGKIRLSTATAGAVVLGLALVELWHALGGTVSRSHVLISLFAAACGGGLLAVPTQAAVQAWSPPERRARSIGGLNVLSATAMVAAAVLLIAGQLAGVTEAALLGITGACSLCVAALMATEQRSEARASRQPSPI